MWGTTGPYRVEITDYHQERIMVRIPTNRLPTHPGEMLRDEFLVPMNISQRDLADAIHVPYQRINEIVNQKRGVTPSTALRLAKFFGLSADFWLNLQIRWDLYNAQAAEKIDLDSIQHFHHLQNIA
jgi:addiction module HigA family antidote